MEQTECSEMSAYKIQTPGNYPEENIQHTEHGESFKSRKFYGYILYLLIARDIEGFRVKGSHSHYRPGQTLRVPEG